MLSKLAFSNVKKSVKDYTIYFLTLMFGVCIFYVFNSIDSQQAMLVLNESQTSLIQSMVGLIGYISVFIAFILGFLIIYANNFLIKRRKKELGIYMTLGMNKGGISRILVLETLLIGIFALAVGLALGILLSQGLAIVTAQMFAAQMKEFQFIFSVDAFIKTLIYFGIIFLVVMIFNVITVSKYKLIDLLTAQKKNQTLKVKKLWVSVVWFIISIALLGFAYWLFLGTNMLVYSPTFTLAILIGVVGTFLFFMSLSGFLLRLVKMKKSFYLKGLNMFVLRQINSKINTTFVSMSMICLMLLVTIGALATGIGISTSMNDMLDKSAPYDATVLVYTKEGNRQPDIKDLLSERGVPYEENVAEEAEIHVYDSGVQYEILFEGKATGGQYDEAIRSTKDVTIGAVSLSDYNRAMTLQQKPPLVLKPGEIAVNCNVSMIQPFWEEYIESGAGVTINGTTYEIKERILEEGMEDEYQLEQLGVFVLPDELVDGMECSEIYYNLNFKPGADEEAFAEAVYAAGSEMMDDNSVAFLNYNTQALIYETNSGLKTIIAYLTLYIGIVFLITSAAVLALQQLSESADNIERYRLLRKIGADEKMVNHALGSQILIYFMMPLILAAIHAVVGITGVNAIILALGMDIVPGILMTCVVILAIYGGYCLATYLASKAMIRERIR